MKMELIIRHTTPDIRCRHRRWNALMHAFNFTPARRLETETADIPKMKDVHVEP